MNRFAFDVRPQLRAGRFVRHQVYRAAQQVLLVELHAEVPLCSRRAIELHKHVDVARVRCVIPRHRTNQRQLSNAILVRQASLVCVSLPHWRAEF